MKNKHPTVILLILACLTIASMLTSCATPEKNNGLAQIATQYATLKVLEEANDITPNGVIRYVETARALVDQDTAIDPTRIAAELLRALDAEDLSPADRILAQALVLQIQAQFQELDLMDPATRLSLLTVLGWIEQAARMMQ